MWRVQTASLYLSMIYEANFHAHFHTFILMLHHCCHYMCEVQDARHSACQHDKQQKHIHIHTLPIYNMKWNILNSNSYHFIAVSNPSRTVSAKRKNIMCTKIVMLPFCLSFSQLFWLFFFLRLVLVFFIHSALQSTHAKACCVSVWFLQFNINVLYFFAHIKFLYSYMAHLFSQKLSFQSKYSHTGIFPISTTDLCLVISIQCLKKKTKRTIYQMCSHSHPHFVRWLFFFSSCFFCFFLCPNKFSLAWCFRICFTLDTTY